MCCCGFLYFLNPLFYFIIGAFYFCFKCLGICLQGQLKRGKVSESDVVAMANDLGKEWMWVGRLLGLEDTALDDIKESHDKLYECSYEMLVSWT